MSVLATKKRDSQWNDVWFIIQMENSNMPIFPWYLGVHPNRSYYLIKNPYITRVSIHVYPNYPGSCTFCAYDDPSLPSLVRRWLVTAPKATNTASSVMPETQCWGVSGRIGDGSLAMEPATGGRHWIWNHLFLVDYLFWPNKAYTHEETVADVFLWWDSSDAGMDQYLWAHDGCKQFNLMFMKYQVFDLEPYQELNILRRIQLSKAIYSIRLQGSTQTASIDLSPKFEKRVKSGTSN